MFTGLLFHVAALLCSICSERDPPTFCRPVHCFAGGLSETVIPTNYGNLNKLEPWKLLMRTRKTKLLSRSLLPTIAQPCHTQCQLLLFWWIPSHIPNDSIVDIMNTHMMSPRSVGRMPIVKKILFYPKETAH